MQKSKWFNSALFIICAILLIMMLEGWGLAGIVIFLLSLVVYKLYKKREAFQAGMSNIETMIWGKPLKKELWEKDELKNTKIKIEWGKSKYFSWKQIFILLLLACGGVLLIISLRMIL